MGEEFYAIIKLVSGEEVFSLIMVDDEQENPIIICLLYTSPSPRDEL